MDIIIELTLMGRHSFVEERDKGTKIEVNAHYIKYMRSCKPEGFIELNGEKALWVDSRDVKNLTELFILGDEDEFNNATLLVIESPDRIRDLIKSERCLLIETALDIWEESKRRL